MNALPTYGRETDAQTKNYPAKGTMRESYKDGDSNSREGMAWKSQRTGDT